MAYTSCEEAADCLDEEWNCVRPEDNIGTKQQIKVTVNVGKLSSLRFTPAESTAAWSD